MKTIVVHKPPRCRKPRLEIFDDHIDKVNNARSKKYLPEKTDILAMGMGGEGLIALYKEKYFGVKRTLATTPKKEKVNKSELKRAIQKQKKFLRGKAGKDFW